MIHGVREERVPKRGQSCVLRYAEPLFGWALRLATTAANLVSRCGCGYTRSEHEVIGIRENCLNPIVSTNWAESVGTMTHGMMLNSPREKLSVSRSAPFAARVPRYVCASSLVC